MIQSLALAGVFGLGIFLLALGCTALLSPWAARRFFLGFARTLTRHCLELAIRLLAGAALVLASPALAGANVFAFLGWVLLGTTGVLAFVPWRLHRAFAQAAVPKALRHLPFIGVVAMSAGASTLCIAIRAIEG